MRNLLFLGYIIIALLGVSCIGDDFIDDFIEAELRIDNAIDTIGIDTEYQLETSFFNNIGKQENIAATWISETPSIVSVTPSGLARGIESGSATLIATVEAAGVTTTKSIEIVVGEATTAVVEGTKRTGSLRTTSSYLLEGNFILEKNGQVLTLTVDETFKATTALPGLHVYLSNNPNSVADAFDIAEVKVFDGLQTYTLPNSIGLNDFNYVLYYCKPFNVKVGDGEMGLPE